jgi:hypothetical protein
VVSGRFWEVASDKPLLIDNVNRLKLSQKGPNSKKKAVMVNITVRRELKREERKRKVIQRSNGAKSFRVWVYAIPIEVAMLIWFNCW